MTGRRLSLLFLRWHRKWGLPLLALVLLYTYVINLAVVRDRLGDPFLCARMTYYAEILKMPDRLAGSAPRCLDAATLAEALARARGLGFVDAQRFETERDQLRRRFAIVYSADWHAAHAAFESDLCAFVTAAPTERLAPLGRLALWLFLIHESEPPTATLRSADPFRGFGVAPRFDPATTYDTLLSQVAVFEEYGDCGRRTWTRRSTVTEAVSWRHTLWPLSVISFYDYKRERLSVTILLALLLSNMALWCFLRALEEVDTPGGLFHRLPRWSDAFLIAITALSFIIARGVYHEVGTEALMNYVDMVCGLVPGFMALLVLFCAHRGPGVSDPALSIAVAKSRLTWVLVGLGCIMVGTIWTIQYQLAEAFVRDNQTVRLLLAVLSLLAGLGLTLSTIRALLAAECVDEGKVRSTLCDHLKLRDLAETLAYLALGGVLAAVTWECLFS